MMPFIYIVLLIALALLGLAFYIEDWVLGILSGMLLFVCGVYIIINGILGVKDSLTYAFGVILFGLASYVIYRGALEKIKESNI
jgi:hypothetical protein